MYCCLGVFLELFWRIKKRRASQVWYLLGLISGIRRCRPASIAHMRNWEAHHLWRHFYWAFGHIIQNTTIKNPSALCTSCSCLGYLLCWALTQLRPANDKSPPSPNWRLSCNSLYDEVQYICSNVQFYVYCRLDSRMLLKTCHCCWSLIICCPILKELVVMFGSECSVRVSYFLACCLITRVARVKCY